MRLNVTEKYLDEQKENVVKLWKIQMKVGNVSCSSIISNTANYKRRLTLKLKKKNKLPLPPQI